MTREEAKQIIATWLVSSKGTKGQRGYIEGWFDEEDVEAFRMAIEALDISTNTPTKSTNISTDAPADRLQTDIVHCEECKHYDEGGFCWHPAAELGDTLATEPTDSCSYGERREDKDYERAIEQMEHDTLYESTYSPEDGSM